MTLGKAIVKTLVESGIDTVFGIPGTQTLPMNKSIEERDDIEYGSFYTGPEIERFPDVRACPLTES